MINLYNQLKFIHNVYNTKNIIILTNLLYIGDMILKKKILTKLIYIIL